MPDRGIVPAPWLRPLGWAALVVALLLAYAVIGTFQTQLSYARSGPAPSFADIFPFHAVPAALWVPVALACLWLAGRWPLGRSRRHLLPHLAAFGVVVVGRALLVVGFYAAVGWTPPELPTDTGLLLSSMLTNVVTFAVLTGLAHVVVYARLTAERDREFAEARMAALAAQIQPHFLFNSLNTIAAFVRREPRQAESMIVDLAALLRSTLDRDSSALVSMESELEITSAYLNIEARRFADQLRVTRRIDPDTLDASIPPFVLQPLLENAVRHGLVPKDGPCQLLVETRRTGHEVEVRIEDDGVGADRDAPAGVGTRHVRDRLRLHFGSRAALVLEPRVGGGTVARLRLPYVPLATRLVTP